MKRYRWNRKSDPDREQKAVECRLLKAAEKGATAELKALLEKGANAVCFGPNGTPLHYSCKNGNLVATNLLLDHGAPCNIMGESSYAPLHLASRYGYTNVVNMLLKSGAKVNIETKSEKRTPLHLAAEAGHHTVVKILIDNGAHVNQEDIYGITPLQQAARTGQADTVKMLLKDKALIDKCDKYGWTALHLASQSGHSEMVKLLLDKNAFINCQNKYGRTPLHWACQANQMSVVETLLSQGAKMDLPDSNGKLASQCTINTAILHVLRIYQQTNTDSFQHIEGDTTIGDLIHLEPVLPYKVERRLSEVSDELRLQRGGSVKSTRSRSDSIAFLDPYVPFFNSATLFYVSGIEDSVLGADCAEELRMANHRYKGLLGTVRALIIVMLGKTESLRTQVVGALDGNTTQSYVEVIKEIYTYLQSIDDSLVDFRQEIFSETTEVTKCLSNFLHKCLEVVDTKASDIQSMKDMRHLHYVASKLSKHHGTWRLLHMQLAHERSLDENRKFLDKIENSHPDEVDRSFESLYSWYVSRSDGETTLVQDIISGLQKCDLGNSQLINEIRTVTETMMEVTIARPSYKKSLKPSILRVDSTISKTVSFAPDVPSEDTESAQWEAKTNKYY